MRGCDFRCKIGAEGLPAIQMLSASAFLEHLKEVRSTMKADMARNGQPASISFQASRVVVLCFVAGPGHRWPRLREVCLCDRCMERL